MWGQCGRLHFLAIVGKSPSAGDLKVSPVLLLCSLLSPWFTRHCSQKLSYRKIHQRFIAGPKLGEPPCHKQPSIVWTFISGYGLCIIETQET